MTVTLDAMHAGGIYDHLAGGFARYATDRAWLVPHFEKMLYDNALLARLYLRAWQTTGIDRYRTVTIETLDYLMSDLADPDGGFHSGEDADAAGVEGSHAVWGWDELADVLGDDHEFAAFAYGATPRATSRVRTCSTGPLPSRSSPNGSGCPLTRLRIASAPSAGRCSSAAGGGSCRRWTTRW